MSRSSQQRTQRYVQARHQHPAWLLLASRRAPLMLGCLETLFETGREGVPFDDAVQALAEMLLAHANQPDFAVEAEEDASLQARRELREWIRRALVVEREGRLYETDALKTALRFAGQLDNRVMTSTASRLAVVQREIGNLAAQLDPDPQSRAAHIQRQLDALELQMQDALAGRVSTLTEEQAIEGIREVYALATSLRADFRRVEDSWREADRALRQSIISEQLHRGAVMDKLLDGHEALLGTQEGRVFENFHQQLANQTELNAMRERIRSILRHPAAVRALDDLQHSDLSLLVLQLLREAKVVQTVRARSEREVSQFMKTGQAAENHRVGQLVNDVLQQASALDWQRQAVRRHPSPLPVLGVGIGGTPLIERLRVKSLDSGQVGDLALAPRYADLAQVEDEFWEAFEGLDRQALVDQTLAVLREAGRPMTLAQLAQALPPGAHDLETMALWLAMGAEAGIAPAEGEECIVMEDDNRHWRFAVPRLALDADAMTAIDWEL